MVYGFAETKRFALLMDFSWTTWLHGTGQVLAHVLVWLLCLTGIVVSCLSFSGPWFVTGASLAALLLVDSPFPGWVTVILFALLAAGAEVMEFFAGAWGVTRRGGSGWAGAAAVVGGLLGLVLGSMLIPIPLVGSLLGMLLGSFGLAFWVEHHRLKKAEHAAHIAFGAVLARILVILMKTLLSLGLTIWLIVGIFVSMIGPSGPEEEALTVPVPSELLEDDHVEDSGT